MHKALRGLDELAVRTAFLGVSAVVAITVFAYALNTAPVQQLARVPVVGRGVTGLRAVFGKFTAA